MDNQSQCESQISKATNHGKHLPKHCSACNDKLIKDWYCHIKKVHQNDKSTIGNICKPGGCKICQNEDIQSQVSQKTNRNAQVTCSLCKQVKRNDTIDKMTGKCRVCLTSEKPKVPQDKAQSMIPKKRTQGKSSSTQKHSEAFIEHQSMLSYQQDVIDFQMSAENDIEEEKVNQMLPPPAKKLKLSKAAMLTFEQQNSQQEAMMQQSSVIVKPIYIDQGMRDSDALAFLQEIEQGTALDDIKQAKLIEVLPFVTQSLFITYLTSMPRPGITFVLQLLLCLAHTFNESQLMNVSFAAVLLGVQTWSRLPKFIGAIQDKLIQKKVLQSLQVHLANHFDPLIADWIISNWEYLTNQTLDLIVNLKKEPTMNAALLLDISLIVDLSNLDEFRLLSNVFLPSKEAFSIFYEALKSQPQQAKMSLQQFGQLSFELRKTQNCDMLNDYREELLKVPLVKWMKMIQTWQTKTLIQDVCSVQNQLDALQEKYGKMPPQFRKDISEAVPAFSYVIPKLTVQPNNVQIALAWYAVTMIFTLPLQMIVFGAGQGKSFVEKLIAFFLIKTKSTAQVHLVYTNQHLLERDKETFQQLITKGNMEESSVSFQLGANFERKPSDIILIDEADQLIFSDPQAFKLMSQNNRCICLTATSDDCDIKGIEKSILQTLGFVGISPVGIAQATVMPPIDKVVSLKGFNANEELYQFIKEKLKTQAVLLYCTLQMKTYLEEQQQEFLYVDQGVTFNTIAKLDQVQQSSQYLLVVSTDPKQGMRGLDYRAPLNGITLIVAASFENQREATQGLYRVGRYKDPCERIAVEGIPVICPKQEDQYFGRLLAFIESCSKQVMAKVPALLKNPQLHKKSKILTFADKSQNKITKFIVRQEQHKQ